LIKPIFWEHRHMPIRDRHISSVLLALMPDICANCTKIWTEAQKGWVIFLGNVVRRKLPEGIDSENEFWRTNKSS
jgi:hypothetical protein